MNKFIKRSIYLCILGSIALVACKKESTEPFNNKYSKITDNGSNDNNSIVEKSTGNRSFDALAQAANIASFTYSSTGNYFIIDSYDDTDYYVITIDDYYLDSLITFNLFINSIQQTVEINFASDSISISGTGSYSFENYYGSKGVNVDAGAIKNIVAAFSAYYGLFGNSTATWSDNGDEDVYKPSWKLFGYEYSSGPCDHLLHIQPQYGDYYFFGIHFSNHDTLTYGPC